MKDLASNENLSCEFINNNIDKEWDWKLLSNNPNINIKFIKENLNKAWDWKTITERTMKRKWKSNYNIMMEDIVNNIDLPWIWKNDLSKKIFKWKFYKKKKKLKDKNTKVLDKYLKNKLNTNLINLITEYQI